MNIDLMRKVDHHLGIPLCFLFSGVDFVLNLFSSRRPLPPKKVVFIELSEMGSAILADPCMREVKARGCELFFLIFSKNKVSLSLLKTVPEENIFVLRESNMLLLLLDAFRFMFWCRKNKIDSCIDLELFSRVTSLLTFLTRARHRVGFHRYHQEGLYRGSFLTHPVPYNHQVHIAHNFMNLVESLLSGVSGDGFLKRNISVKDLQVAQAVIEPARLQSVREKIERMAPDWKNAPIVLVNANAGEFLPQRRWPKEYFVQLIGMILRDQPEAWVLLTGSASEKEDLDVIVQGVQSTRCVNFAGQVKFEELPALYTMSKILITNDSGPGHFSSVTKIKSFVFFGPETPSLYGSLGNSTAFYANYSCSPCVSATNHRKTDCTDNQCLKVLRPEVVYPAIQKSYREDVSR